MYGENMLLEDDILNDIEDDEEMSNQQKSDGEEKQRGVQDEDDESEEVTAEMIQEQRAKLTKRIVRQRNESNSPVDKQKRLAVIQVLMDSNETDEKPVNVQKALKSKGIDVSLVTICKDMRELANVTPETMRKVDSLLVGKLRSYLAKLEDIADESDSDETRIRAINAAFEDTRKMYDILDTIATRAVLEETEKMKLGKLTNPINEIIQFIDSPERVNKDIFYQDERNKIIEWLQGEIGNLIEKDTKTYKTFSTPMALHTMQKATSDILNIIRSLKDVPYRKKDVQQEKAYSEDNIKIDKLK